MGLGQIGQGAGGSPVGDIVSGAFDFASLANPVGLLAGGIGSFIGGLFSRDTSNPLDYLKDPNNPFYKTAQANYYKNLSRVLGANTPGKATLLASQAASGGDYGGSAYVAGKQNENLLVKGRDAAIGASNEFEDNLFTKGMTLAASGDMAQYQDRNSFSNELMTLGGGLFSRFFKPDNTITTNPQESWS